MTKIYWQIPTVNINLNGVKGLDYDFSTKKNRLTDWRKLGGRAFGQPSAVVNDFCSQQYSKTIACINIWRVNKLILTILSYMCLYSSYHR